jgi:uridine monophosphate synthetase
MLPSLIEMIKIKQFQFFIKDNNNVSNMEKKQILKKLIDIGCIKKGVFTLKSGITSSYYIDLRLLISYPDLLKNICDHLYKLIEHKNLNSKICGLPYAGIPYSCCLSTTYNLEMLMLRKEQKSHGTKKMLEGLYNVDDNLIIIDDILTSGTSIKESLNYLQNFNIKQIIVIFDRNQGGSQELTEMGYKINSLFNIKEIEEYII